jgi:hypothetical protein
MTSSELPSPELHIGTIIPAVKVGGLESILVRSDDRFGTSDGDVVHTSYQ